MWYRVLWVIDSNIEPTAFDGYRPQRAAAMDYFVVLRGTP